MLVYGKIIYTTKGTKITKKLKNISSKVIHCILRDLCGYIIFRFGIILTFFVL
jgi:hypothetical protein